MNETNPTIVITNDAKAPEELYAKAAALTKGYLEQINKLIEDYRTNMRAIYPNSQSYGLAQLIPVFMVDTTTDINAVKNTFFDYGEGSTIFTYDVDGVNVKEQIYPF